jgi:hypothetical protein
VVLNRPEGVAGCALRQQHPDLVSGCDWLLCEANPIQRCHLLLFLLSEFRLFCLRKSLEKMN